MKFMMGMADYSHFTDLNYKNSLEIMEEWNTYPVMEFIGYYRYNWKKHVFVGF
jgi:hypothetical protein